jgi:hypothetical protein
MANTKHKALIDLIETLESSNGRNPKDSLTTGITFAIKIAKRRLDWYQWCDSEDLDWSEDSDTVVD